MTTVSIDFIGKKARDADNPYALFTGNMFGGPATFKVLKKYKNDDGAQYSAWLIAAATPATFGSDEYGDTYVADVVPHLSLTEVDGRKPTQEEFAAIAKLRSVLESDGTSEVFTFNEISMGASPTPKKVESVEGLAVTTINLAEGTVS